MDAALASGSSVVVPEGVYRVRDLDLCDGVTIEGDGWRSSWIKGHITFGSSTSVSGLKIGTVGVSAIHNRSRASNTVFTACRFRGGGGRMWTYVVDLGSAAPCDHITFRQCLVERNQGSDPYGEKGFNDVTIWAGRNAPVSDITFEGCRIGVSNGRRGHSRGSPRMGLECYVHDGTAAWSNVTLRDTVFEAADFHTADFSDHPDARGTGLLIEGCTFKGGGLKNRGWKYVVDLEMPLNPVIRDNRFLRGRGGWGYVLNITDRGQAGYGSSGALITGNVFDLDANNGIPREKDSWPFAVQGHDNDFSGNTIICHYGWRPLVMLDRAFSSSVTGNTFRVGSRALFGSVHGSAQNRLTPNTVY